MVYIYSDNNSYSTGRWWASWLLLVAYVPIAFLYFFWIPLSCTGNIEPEYDSYEYQGFSPNELYSDSLLAPVLLHDEEAQYENNQEIPSTASESIQARVLLQTK